MADVSGWCLGVLAVGMTAMVVLAAFMLQEIHRIRHEVGRVMPRYARAADEASDTLRELRRLLKRANRVAEEIEHVAGEARGMTIRLLEAASQMQHHVSTWLGKRMGNGARVDPRRPSRV